MKRNIELKLRCPNVQEARRIALCLPAELHADLRQRDTYFHTQTGRLKLREIWDLGMRTSDPADSAEPTRPADRSELIWYQRPDEPQLRTSDYRVVPVEDGEALSVVLRDALGVAAEVVKVRSVYLWRNVRIHIDEVAGLGTFLEFEAIVDETCEESAARAKAQQLCDAFGVTPDQIISVSYADLPGLDGLPGPCTDASLR
jgi:adenylate cyclase, class 2